jgi:tetratricopeptide (TPR) repeat protein
MSSFGARSSRLLSASLLLLSLLVIRCDPVEPSSVAAGDDPKDFFKAALQHLTVKIGCRGCRLNLDAAVYSLQQAASGQQRGYHHTASRMLLAKVLLWRGDIDQAVVVAKLLPSESERGKSFVMHLQYLQVEHNLALAAFRDGKAKEAFCHVSNILRNATRSPSLLLFRARCAHSLKEFSIAKHDAGRALLMDSSNPEALTIISQALFNLLSMDNDILSLRFQEQNRLFEASKLAKEALRLSPDSVESQAWARKLLKLYAATEEGHKQHALKKPALAIRAYITALSLDSRGPLRPFLLWWVSNSYFLWGVSLFETDGGTCSLANAKYEKCIAWVDQYLVELKADESYLPVEPLSSAYFLRAQCHFEMREMGNSMVRSRLSDALADLKAASFHRGTYHIHTLRETIKNMLFDPAGEEEEDLPSEEPPITVSKRDYYEVLGLHKNATLAMIKRAYKLLALKYHPDKNRGNETEAAEAFLEVAEAYSVLSDATKRKAWDGGQMNTAGQGGQNSGKWTYSFDKRGRN